jgi:hypothetical protein
VIISDGWVRTCRRQAWLFSGKRKGRRAYALSGDKTKAKAAYQDFLTLWKDADPDIPTLKQAKAEYAKLN